MKIGLNLLIIASFITASFFNKNVKLNEKFDVQKNEIVTVQDTNLDLKVIASGHDTFDDWSSHKYFCRFEAKLNGETKERELYSGESLIFENLNIRFIGLKETHLKDDSRSVLSCKFIVTKNKK